jgi:hypothetical protein
VLRAALEREQRLSEWINLTFSGRIPLDFRICPPYFGMLDAKYLCQELTLRTSVDRSVLWSGESVAVREGKWRAVHDCFIRHHSSDLAVAIERANGTYRFCEDAVLAFVCNISVGEQGLFFVVDPSAGTSMRFRIEYRERGDVTFVESTRMDVDGVPRTVVSDMDALGATFSGNILTFWNRTNGIGHRRIGFESDVKRGRSIMF